MISYVTKSGDRVDYIAWKRYGTHDGKTTEKLLEANPGLAAHGPVLPAGLTIILPDITPPAAENKLVKLWD